jgi:hypothetical protein
MPIEFYCSQCRNRLRVADSAAGKEAQCPVCGAIVAVPATGAAGYPPYTPGTVGPKTSASGEGIAPVPPIPPEAVARPVPPGNAPVPPPGVGPQPAWYDAHSTQYMPHLSRRQSKGGKKAGGCISHFGVIRPLGMVLPLDRHRGGNSRDHLWNHGDCQRWNGPRNHWNHAGGPLPHIEHHRHNSQDGHDDG